MTDHTSWLSIDVTAPGAVEDICSALERSPLAKRATLFHDPRWVGALANQQDKSARIYALREQGGLAGLATFLVYPSALRLALGELTLLSRPVRRLNAFAAPLAEADGDRSREISILADLLARMREDLDRNEVIFLESVAEGTAMFDLVTQPAALVGGFHALQYGNLYRHRFAAISDSFEGFLKQLRAHTRADLRTNRKRFIAHVQQNYRTRCFRTRAEVSEFLAESMELSRKTYQYQLLGSGLRDREMLERCYLAASELGWFRSYVLYANEKPIAFHVGYVYHGRFHSAVIGYDPEWARHHVGIFLFTEIIADLAASNGAIKEFDFGNDDDVYKERLSTGFRLEGYFYLIPAHFRGSLMARSMRITNMVSAALGAVLGRFGIRTKVRDLLRKLGVMK